MTWFEGGWFGGWFGEDTGGGPPVEPPGPPGEDWLSTAWLSTDWLFPGAGVPPVEPPIPPIEPPGPPERFDPHPIIQGAVFVDEEELPPYELYEQRFGG